MEMLTQRDVMNLISRTVAEGLPVSRVLIAARAWWGFLEDCPSSAFTGPLQVCGGAMTLSIHYEDGVWWVFDRTTLISGPFYSHAAARHAMSVLLRGSPQ